MSVSVFVVLVVVLLDRPLWAGRQSAPLTLADALARAEARHPRLTAARLEVEARGAEIAQAARRPNPSVAVEVEDLARNAGSAMPSQTTVSVAQRFELGDKRGLRTDLARIEYEVAGQEAVLERVVVFQRVAAAFVDVLLADAELVLAREEAATAREMAAAVAARVDAGVAAPPEGDRAAAAAATAEVGVARAEQTRRSAGFALASTWGDADATVSGALTTVAVPPMDALTEVLEASPQLVRFDLQRRLRERQRDVAAAAGIPDLDIGGGFRRLHDNADTAWVAGATVTWPLFDRQRDRVTAATLRLQAAASDREAARLDARAALGSAHGAATGARLAAVEFETRIIPLNERAYAAVLEGYQAGRFGLLQVLDARRSLADARRDHLAALAELQRSLIAIQGLLGATPSLAPSTTGARQ